MSKDFFLRVLLQLGCTILEPSNSFKEYFDKEEITQILPFDRNNPLDAGVQSDHAEIAVRIASTWVINIWNICNVTYHDCFKYGDNPPFYRSHLFVEKPFINDILDKRLVEKSEDQINTIAARFVNGNVNIQIIIEGSTSFYQKLARKIHALGHKKFEIVTSFQKTSKEENVPGILVDTSRFSIIERSTMCTEYCEKEDFDQKRVLTLPYVCLASATHRFVVAAAHVNGCRSQYPKSGLENLANMLKSLKMKISEEMDLIVGGDFNTSPKNLRNSFKELLGERGVLLNAPYPTHVNPKSQADNYDQIVILRGTKSENYEMLPITSLSASSQNLVHSIARSRQKYLLRAKL